jgi:ATP-dependent DNA helicase RecG
MMAEQVEDSRDIKILKGFSENDLDTESIKAYRNMLSAHKSNHPWLNLDQHAFLFKLGCWRTNRETGEEGLTLAGLLMFGESRAINESLPNYFPDYQELPTDTSEIRWLDRIVSDGTWSGNVFDFYRRVIRKLEQDLKVPFSIKNNIRQDDTLTHQAIREALINCLIHADYSDRASVKIVKSSKGFRFRNPGMMRIPAEVALEGGESDCRNRTLHKLFLLLGLGEQAGSGLPKIKQGWSALGNSLKISDNKIPYDQTVMELNWHSEDVGVNAGVNVGVNNPPDLSELDINILNNNNQTTIRQLSTKLEKTSRTIERRLKHLKEIGKLTRVGSVKTGHWEIIE